RGGRAHPGADRGDHAARVIDIAARRRRAPATDDLDAAAKVRAAGEIERGAKADANPTAIAEAGRSAAERDAAAGPRRVRFALAPDHAEPVVAVADGDLC